MQLLVPILLALSFAWRGHTLGTAFCGWATFNSLTGVAIYMMDARAKGLAQSPILFIHALKNASVPIVTTSTDGIYSRDRRMRRMMVPQRA